jgi:succinate dehydrogenase/fumarate reductase flavoprotein subunit
VVVVEKAHTLGGSAVLSGGKLWTAPDRETLAAETPGGDPTLCAAVFETYHRVIDWVRSTGVAVSGPITVLDFGRGYEIDIVDYVERCRAIVEDAGGLVVRGATVEELVVEHGRVAGAIVADRDGRTRVRSPWTLLASGGFSANPELRHRFLHRNGDRALRRSNPDSVGDGLRLGLAAGAALSPVMSGFYGHLVCTPLRDWTPREFRVFAQGHSDRSVLVNRAGRRFADESLGDHVNAQEVLAQPDAIALLLADDRIRREDATFALPDGAGALDKIGIAIDEGANVACGETWADALAAVDAWGFDRVRALATIESYDRAMAGGGAPPDAPRRRHRRPLQEGTRYAIQVECGVTATHGGLRVDATARVLDGYARPVPGLLAAGADAGNAYGRGYAGGLAFASTFGLLAAEHAVRRR